MPCTLNRRRNIHAGSTVAIVFAVLVLTISSETASATTKESVTTQASTGRTVWPTGWRRTTRGWERAEVWAGTSVAAVGFESYDGRTYQRRFAAVGGTPPQTVSQWMVWDRAREPVWANNLLGGVRTVHPLMAASFLIATAILITQLSERNLANRCDTSAGSLNA